MARAPIALALLALAGGLALAGCRRSGAAWSPLELATLHTISLDRLPDLPPDPSNAVADDPRAAALGRELFFSTDLSANRQVSCATCHNPELGFGDGLALSKGLGTTARHAPSIVGTAYSPWLFWDGRVDSQWAQALGPLEHPAEQGMARTGLVQRVAALHGPAFAELFGPWPDFSDAGRFPPNAAPRDDMPGAREAWDGMQRADQQAVNRAYSQVGKVIAAYDRKLQFGPGRLEAYIKAVESGDQGGRRALNGEEEAGLRLFIGKAGCISCHNGPRLTNDEFHNIGLPLQSAPVADAAGQAPTVKQIFDTGREAGVLEVVDDLFNCRGGFSDAHGADDCAELRFVKVSGDSLPGAFKVPSLRNVALSAPYMHDGRFQTLDQVIAHYNAAPVPVLGHADLKPLKLSGREQAQLKAFLEALTAPLATEAEWLKAPGPDR